MNKGEIIRNLSYKKVIAKDVNLEQIKQELWDILEECEDVRYFFDEDDDILIDVLDGNEDEASEIKMLFSDLAADCERMRDDLYNEYVPECFDILFAAVSSDNSLLGWDKIEGDYFGFNYSYEEKTAIDEAQKKLLKLTKQQILDASQICFRIFRSYMGLKYRYDCLKAVIEVIKEKNGGYLREIRKIEDAYTRANKDNFIDYYESTRELDRLANNMPSLVWVA